MGYRKMYLKINGANRMIVCDPEADTLSDVVRRIGLTGTKIGCGIGVCGACSVILDGKVIRSCTKKMKTVKEFAEVTTIEGIGSANYLHPLQQAFITFGAVQCGFCIPGFIVSAYALLQENNAPTREEVRAWFKKNHNYCRCTGYKQITDAVMAAAKVMRGEATMDDIIYKHPMGERYYNSKLPRPTALGKVTGTIDYGGDMAYKMPDGLLHAAIVQPCVTHHAVIKSIDISEAVKAPGVQKVITAKDIIAVGGNNLINQMVGNPRALITESVRPILCDKKIFHWGDVIAVVVADTRAHARAAAKLVKMDYEELPAYLTLPEAVTPDALQIHPGFPNSFMEQQVLNNADDIDDIIENSAYSVTASFHTQHQPHLSIEGDVTLAYRDEKGRLTIECKSQGIYPNLMVVGKGIGLKDGELRILQHGAVGASFGWAIDPAPLSLVGVSSIIMNAPVSLVMSWEEHQHFDGKRSAAWYNTTFACDENGKLTAMKYDCAIDHGCYAEGSDTVIRKYMHFGVPYTVDHVKGLVRMVTTNNDHCTAWRGYGMPQNASALEPMMDMLAEKVGMDPFEFRYINLQTPGTFSPNRETSNGLQQYKKMMDLARPWYQECKKRAAELSTDEVKRGVGVAPLYFSPLLAKNLDKAEARIELKEDGRFYVYETYQEMGQGGDIGSLAGALEALKELGVTPADIVLDINDTDDCPNSGISASSRSHYMNTAAINEAGKLIIAAMRKEDGTFRTYAEMKAEGIETSYTGFYTIAGQGFDDLDWNTGCGVGKGFVNRPMMGLVVSEVEVNTVTGKPQVLSIRSWADCGVIGNYLAAEGQAFGGFGQNVGYAFSEDYQDVKKHGNLIGAGLPSIEDVPDDMVVTWLEDDPNKEHPFGSNGLSELFFSGEHEAFLGAVYDACHVRIYELPATADKIKAGLAKVAAGEKTESPEPYYLGNDMEDEIDELNANPIPANWMALRKAMIERLAAEKKKKADEGIFVDL